MVGSSKSVTVGVIAEEKNDFQVLEQLSAKVVPRNRIAFKSFIAHGSGKLRVKCDAWASTLRTRGCTHIIVMHDLDQHEAKNLKADLYSKIGGKTAYSLVLLPKREVEAWLLCDANAIRAVFNMTKAPDLPRSPEALMDPKGTLSKIARASSRTVYINTVHNAKIAKELNLGLLKAFPSFSEFPEFIKKLAKS